MLCLFVYTLIIYFDYYVFTFLSEKFKEFQIQYIIFVIAFSGLIGVIFYTFFLVTAPRRILNFMISGGISFLSFVMVIASLTMQNYYVEVIGLFALCKYINKIINSFYKSTRSIWFRILHAVQCRTIPVACARIYSGRHVFFIQYWQYLDSLFWYLN